MTHTYAKIIVVGVYYFGMTDVTDEQWSIIRRKMCDIGQYDGYPIDDKVVYKPDPIDDKCVYKPDGPYHNTIVYTMSPLGQRFWFSINKDSVELIHAKGAGIDKCPA